MTKSGIVTPALSKVIVDIVLGYSGGIDSQTTAQQLIAAGHRVIALTIETIDDREMMLRAEESARNMNIEWLGYDAKELFECEIIDYFCHSYSIGHTPAPCTLCNPKIKWKILREVADKLGIEHIATGHYVNIERHNDKYYIAKGIDSNKDQSYYLWGLEQDILRRAITPMGQRIKSEVKLSYSDKRESMSICFVRGLHYTEFLASRGLSMPSGDIADSMGNICGSHNGISRYTIGQRRGKGIPEGMRVIDIDAKYNRLIVGDIQRLYKHKLYVEQCNIVDEKELLAADDITIKIRGIGRNPELAVKVERCGCGYVVTSPDAAWAPAKGQPLVFYRNNLVIGGGIVVDFE